MQNLLLYTHTGVRACTRYFFKYYYKLIENCEWFFLAIARFSCVFMNRKIYISNQKFILKALHDIFLTHGYILSYRYWYKCLYEACYMRARACGRYPIMISIILIHLRYSLSQNIRITHTHTHTAFIYLKNDTFEIFSCLSVALRYITMEIRSKLAGIQSGNPICCRLCAPRSQSDRRARMRQTFSRSNLRLPGVYFPLCSRHAR